MAIPPGLNIAKDVTSSYLNHGKANAAPERSPQRFGATVSTWLGITGATTGFLSMPKVAGVFPVSPLALKGVADLKNSVGAFPAMISTISGYQSGDKTATALGAANFLCATGFFRVAEDMAKTQAENMAKQQAKNFFNNPTAQKAVANLPAYVKFGIGVATIAYTYSQQGKTTKLD